MDREVWEQGHVSQNVQSCYCIGQISSRDPVDNLISIVNNIELYTGNFLEVDFR